ncbi:glycosyltransferase family 2 protein [Actinacidiphila oryziradicis]|uniref:Glycosyltransferase family 2 protein n=1 Tax=Actinacidiphila oryziradicis TaxID=2571141 RepID=A0A4V5N0V3_9ACTN|nr:glycosyltransferase family 2 protein [Actinacidiphila oryziradicis]
MPIYNAGSYIDSCPPSLVNQSLGPNAYEVVYVDDGSTDDSAERLNRLKAAHPHVRVHHQENSVWPGKPRNVGVDLARGEYVQLVDQDDELAPEALERLCALAARNGSDIVLGKVRGTMQGPSNVFKRTVERCTAADAPLFESLTPHKMFRRDFLLDHGIRFPEGRVRLEDQLFMARAYVRAKTVSVLGDYPCYQWNRREDGGNNSSSSAITPDDCYGHLGNVVEAIKEGTRPVDGECGGVVGMLVVERQPGVVNRSGPDLPDSGGCGVLSGIRGGTRHRKPQVVTGDRDREDRPVLGTSRMRGHGGHGAAQKCGRAGCQSGGPAAQRTTRHRGGFLSAGIRTRATTSDGIGRLSQGSSLSEQVACLPACLSAGRQPAGHRTRRPACRPDGSPQATEPGARMNVGCDRYIEPSNDQCELDMIQVLLGHPTTRWMVVAGNVRSSGRPSLDSGRPVAAALGHAGEYDVFNYLARKPTDADSPYTRLSVQVRPGGGRVQ